MSRSLRFLPEALEDALTTQRWYAEREPGLDQAFANDLAACVARIIAEPLAFPCVHGQVRRLVMRRFPYALYFRDTASEIVVVALHGRQDPRRWQSRL